MDNNYLYDGLLVRYLANEVNAGEREFVKGWMDDSQENNRYFEQLKDVWQLLLVKHTINHLDDINVNEEWDRFKKAIVEKETGEKEQYEGE